MTQCKAYANWRFITFLWLFICNLSEIIYIFNFISIVIDLADIVNWMIKAQSNMWGLCEFIDETFSWCSYDVFITDLGKLKLNNLVFAMLSHNVSTS